MPGGIHYLDATGPEGVRLYAIGDVHGRLDLLTAMHRRIGDDLASDPPADWRIIHLGDYVDRGPDSKGVIDFLIGAQLRDGRNLAVRGNHDVGLIDFLNDPDPRGLFAMFGGDATARSYGIEKPDFRDPAIAEELKRLVPDAHRRFIANLSFSQTFGDFFFCHAGVRPGVPLTRQALRDLMWIRGEFHNWPELFEKVIVHGHTPHHEPEVLANRVNLDTEAWRSGVLTALAIDGTRKRILSVEGAPG